MGGMINAFNRGKSAVKSNLDNVNRIVPDDDKKPPPAGGGGGMVAQEEKPKKKMSLSYSSGYTPTRR
jgi:hypothetical protein